eukprot:NODE_20_length_39102_cov_0.325513.p2 type:complete len:894 gc:universal NODE_20_length_39102_cov_0.325513:37837-35156(-)
MKQEFQISMLNCVQQPLTDLPDVSEIYKIEDEKYLGKILAFYLMKLQALGRSVAIKHEFISHCIAKQYQQSIAILVKHGFCNDELIEYSKSMTGKYQMKAIGYILLSVPDQERLQFMFLNLNKPWRYTTAKLLAQYYKNSEIQLSQLLHFMKDYQYTQGVLLLFSEFIRLKLVHISNSVLFEYLHLDKRIGTASVGQGIRDCTLFVLWRKTRHAQVEDVDMLSLHLILVCCFDPVHHVRRAASAVFTELVGRYSVLDGLLLLPYLDYYTIGHSNRSHMIGSRVPLLNSFYRNGIIHYLVTIIQSTMDTDLLMNRCAVLAKVIKYAIPDGFQTCKSAGDFVAVNSASALGNPLSSFSPQLNITPNQIPAFVNTLFTGDYFKVQAACHLSYCLFNSTCIESGNYDISFGALSASDQIQQHEFVKLQQLPDYEETARLNPAVSDMLCQLHSICTSNYALLKQHLVVDQFEFILQVKCLCILIVGMLKHCPDESLLNDLLCILFDKLMVQEFDINSQDINQYPMDLKMLVIEGLLQLDGLHIILDVARHTNVVDHVIVIIEYLSRLISTKTQDKKDIEEIIQLMDSKYDAVNASAGQIKSRILRLYLQITENYGGFADSMIDRCAKGLIDYTVESKGDTGSFVRQSSCKLFTSAMVGMTADSEVIRKCVGHIIYASYSNIDKLRLTAISSLDELKEIEYLELKKGMMCGAYKKSYASGIIQCLNGHDTQRIKLAIESVKSLNNEEMYEFMSTFTGYKRKECKINHIYKAGCLLIENEVMMDTKVMDYMSELFNKLVKNKSTIIVTNALELVIKLVFMDISGIMIRIVELMDNIAKVKNKCVEVLYNIYSIMPEYYNVEVGELLMTVEWEKLNKTEIKRYQEVLKKALQKNRSWVIRN